MRKLLLTLSLAAITTGAVSTNVYAADSNTLVKQFECGKQVISKEIKLDSTCDINKVLANLKNCGNLYSTNVSGTNIPGLDKSKLQITEAKTTKKPAKATKKCAKKTKAPAKTTKAPAKTTKAPVTTTKAPAKTTEVSKENTATNLSFTEQVVKLVNAERVKAGLAPVKVDVKLSNAALVRAKEIERSFSHTRPSGSGFSTVLAENGVSYRGAGENIAYGQKTPEQVMEGWMNSEGHRANILNKNFTSIGVGYYQNGSGVNYWSQLFTY